ncbi:DNA-processing protein DprA [Acetobacterium tundrae]|nr:DNA-processing protein DprA [Acetobacterium tundrae]
MNKIDFNRNIIALLQLKGVGRQKIKMLMQMINQPQCLSFKELIEIGQMFHLISPDIDLKAQNNSIAYANKVIETSAKYKIKLVSSFDENFPASLDFKDSPVMLYYQGNLELLNHNRRAAVIGSRNPTPAGAEFSFESGKFLATENFVVISGLATGCDYYGHLGCLSTGGKTIAFLPAGLINIYPIENKPLAEKILVNDGCILSEYTPFENPQPYRFIERDRLQSASSMFVIVSTFSCGSGTIHTLNFAKQYNKKIFSIPAIFDESKDAFNKLNQKKILFEIYEKDKLHNLITNY